MFFRFNERVVNLDDVSSFRTASDLVDGALQHDLTFKDGSVLTLTSSRELEHRVTQRSVSAPAGFYAIRMTGEMDGQPYVKRFPVVAFSLAMDGVTWLAEAFGDDEVHTILCPDGSVVTLNGECFKNLEEWIAAS